MARIAERIDTRTVGITHKGYVALAALEVRALRGESIHFSQVVRANRLGGTPFVQGGSRYSKRTN